MLRIRAILLLLAAGFACAAEPGIESSVGRLPEGKTSRVTMVHARSATTAFSPNLERVREMVHAGLTNLTGELTPQAAWRKLVQPTDTIGVKVSASAGAIAGTRPEVALAVIESLLSSGFPAAQVILWDRSLADLRAAGYPAIAERVGVRLAGSSDTGYDEKVFYEAPVVGRLVWGDLEFNRKEEGVGKKSYLSKLLTQQLTKIISLAPLLNHNQGGTSGHLIGLALGSIDNVLRFENDGDRLADAVPELFALEPIGDRLVLAITDALFAQYYGEEQSLLHYTGILNELWFSKDPVALDALALAELDAQRQLAGLPKARPRHKLYENAAFLELGVDDSKRIRSVRLDLN